MRKILRGGAVAGVAAALGAPAGACSRILWNDNDFGVMVTARSGGGA